MAFSFQTNGGKGHEPMCRDLKWNVIKSYKRKIGLLAVACVCVCVEMCCIDRPHEHLWDSWCLEMRFLLLIRLNQLLKTLKAWNFIKLKSLWLSLVTAVHRSATRGRCWFWFNLISDLKEHNIICNFFWPKSEQIRPGSAAHALDPWFVTFVSTFMMEFTDFHVQRTEQEYRPINVV